VIVPPLPPATPKKRGQQQQWITISLAYVLLSGPSLVETRYVVPVILLLTSTLTAVIRSGVFGLGKGRVSLVDEEAEEGKYTLEHGQLRRGELGLNFLLPLSPTSSRHITYNIPSLSSTRKRAAVSKARSWRSMHLGGCK